MACYLAPWTNSQCIWVNNQSGWIETHNDWGEIFASASDIYRAGKESSSENLHRLQPHFAKYEIVTSTNVFSENLQMRIIQHYGSRIIPPTDSKTVPLHHYFFNNNPVLPLPQIPGVRYNQKYLSKLQFSLENLLSQENGLPYLQALFSTSDEPKEILQTLERFSGKKKENLQISTRPQDKDNSYAIGFKTTEEAFFISFIPTNYHHKHSACAAVFDEETVKKLDEGSNIHYTWGGSRFDKESLSKEYESH
ncbi:hypothetical protein HYU21_03880 [Candidatus Woesearchaeota archaeon]|nr:hypothetical protein [Candidatus Woesearchaeota archaeon]